MKFLVLAAIAACVYAKPVEKTLEKRQLNGYPFVSQYVNQPLAKSAPFQFQGLEGQSNKIPSGYYNSGLNQFNFAPQTPVLVNDQTFPQGVPSLNNVQPEITNVGNSGLNSNAPISTTTIAPSSDSFSLPTSTFSPLANSEIVPFNSIGSSGVFPQNTFSTVSPLSEISSTYAPSTFSSLNANPTAFPIVSSSPVPTDFVQTRFSPNNVLLDTLNQRVDLSSFNFNNLNNYQPTFDFQSNYDNVLPNDARAPEVTKNFYFYEAPEDLEPVRQRKIVQLPNQKINHKILVIKAPAAPEPQPIEIPAQVLNSEKTRVYVLVKKPETEQQIRIVAGQSAKPEKPEVFFIKYKTQEEAEKAIKEAQAGAAYGQESLNVDGEQLLSHLKTAKIPQTIENLYVKQTVKSAPSVALNFVRSTTALPFVSTTGPIGNFFESSTATPLLNPVNYNQLPYYNTPVLANKFVSSPQNTVYSNYFPYGNFGVRSNSLNSYGSFPTYVSSGYSNIPLELSKNPQVGFRTGRIDNSGEEKNTILENQPNLEHSPVVVKEEPVSLTVGESESNNSEAAPAHVTEYTSNSGSAEIDSTTVPSS